MNKCDEMETLINIADINEEPDNIATKAEYYMFEKEEEKKQIVFGTIVYMFY